MTGSISDFFTEYQECESWKDAFEAAVRFCEVNKHAGSSTSFNLVGPAGCGKTGLLHTIAGHCIRSDIRYCLVDAAKLVRDVQSIWVDIDYKYFNWNQSGTPVFLIDNFDAVADHPDLAKLLDDFIRGKVVIVSREPIATRSEFQFRAFDSKTVYMGQPSTAVLAESLHEEFYWVYLPDEERVLRHETCFRFARFGQGNFHRMHFATRNVMGAMNLVQAPFNDKNVNKFLNRFLSRADEPKVQQALRSNQFFWLK